MIRSFLLRYVVPLAVAVTVVALIGVPYIDRVLDVYGRENR